MKKLYTEWRVWLFLLVLVWSIFSIGYNPARTGVVVENVALNSPLAAVLSPGETINAINEEPVHTPEDVYKWNGYSGVLRIVHNNKIDIIGINGRDLGITVGPVPSSRLSLGMDMVGGTRVLLAPQYPANATAEEKTEIADSIISALQTRTNVYGLKELSLQPLRDVAGNTYVQIETAGTSLDEINSVLSRQGRFEAFVTRGVVLTNSSGSFKVDGNSHEVALRGDEILVDGTPRRVNETFRVENLTVKTLNFTETSALFLLKVYDGNDIKFVHTDAANAYVTNVGGGWRFAFTIIVSDVGSARFATATRGLQKIGSGDNCYLSEEIRLYLDDILVSSLSVGCTLEGQPYSTPQISGGGNSEEDARQEMRRLQSVLKSGSLPVKLDIVKVDRVSASLGQEFLNSIVTAGAAAAAAVSLIVYLRYRRLKLVLPMLLISFSEILIVLGVAAAIRWTIDLAAIAGIIAIIGTSVDNQIVIIDEALSGARETASSTSERLKRALFIIFGSAATIVAAMIPLGLIGIGVMRGFALTTVIGVVVGIFIARPVFAKIVERLV